MEQQGNFKRHLLYLEFFISIWLNGREYRMKVKRSVENESKEKFEIIAGTRSVIVSTNRRFIKTMSLNKGLLEWHLEKGTVSNREVYEETLLAINQHMDLHEKKYPVYQYQKFVKRK